MAGHRYLEVTLLEPSLLGGRFHVGERVAHPIGNGGRLIYWGDDSEALGVDHLNEVIAEAGCPVQFDRAAAAALSRKGIR